MTKLYLLLITINFFFIIFIFIQLINPAPHPMTIIWLLVSYRILICLTLSIWKNNYLYSFIIFLIIIRGLLIIFIYFSRLVSNEKFFINYKIITFKSFIITIIIFLIFILNKKTLFFNHLFYKFNEINTINMINIYNLKNISNIYNFPYNNLTIISILFLLISLILIIKISSKNYITLRKIN